MTTLIFFAELIALFFLSRVLTRVLSRKVSIRLMSFLFLPGIIIHELSHMLVAAILFVPVGEIEFTPKVTEGRVKLGSAAIGKTDPIRRAIIGLAPILVGLFILFTTATFYKLQAYEFFSIPTLLVAFIIFEVSNTMFSSLKDIEGLIEVIAAAIILFVIFYLFTAISGVGIPQITVPIKELEGILEPLIIPLTIAVIIDGAVIGVLKIPNF